MLVADKPFDRHRFEFRESLTHKEIDDLASNADVRVLQSASPVQPQTWELLNQNLFSRRSNIELRVYGFYSSTCDLSFASKISNVRRFSADCLQKAVGVENLAAMEHLEELHVGIFGLENFDFLRTLPRKIKSLTLGPTKSRKPRLEGLDGFQSLSKLCLAGQQSGISALAELQGLEQVSLRCISTAGLEYVSRLPRLRSLDIMLGGIRSLSAISDKESIRFLQLWHIRGLSDISVISSLTGLQCVFLRELRNVTSIPDLSHLTKLRRLYLDNLKGLKDVGAIQHAPALEQFIHVAAQNMRLEQYKDLLGKATLQELLIGFGNKRRNEEFESLLTQSGKSKYSHSEFIFR